MTQQTAPKSPALKALGTIFTRISQGEKVPPMEYFQLFEEATAKLKDQNWSALEQIIDAMPADRRSDAAYQLWAFCAEGSAQSDSMLERVVANMAPSPAHSDLLRKIVSYYVGETALVADTARLKKVMDAVDRFPQHLRAPLAHDFAHTYAGVEGVDMKAWKDTVRTPAPIADAMTIGGFATKIAALTAA